MIHGKNACNELHPYVPIIASAGWGQRKYGLRVSESCLLLGGLTR